MAQKADRPSRATCIKYALLQLPSLLLTALVLLLFDAWFSLPGWLFWSVLGAWALKDLALFPFLWRSYAVDTVTTGHPPSGSPGVVRETLAPEGLVEIRGELWQATSVPRHRIIPVGANVRVVSARNLLLEVEPGPAPEETGRTSGPPPAADE